MKVSIAEYAGFCFGVERAIKIVYDVAEKEKDVVTYGPLIHNPQVVEALVESGVSSADSLSSINSNDTVVIRTHGITIDEYNELRNITDKVIDATCPFVQKVQNSAKKLSEEGFKVVVVGDIHHPEVQSIVSHIPNSYEVVPSIDEAKKLDYEPKYGVVAQTTQNNKVYQQIVDILRTKCDIIKVSNTICDATHKRQKAALDLASEVDAMIIVGGMNSANTTRLYQLCKEVCSNSYHIETVANLEDEMFIRAAHVGITAGASTPIKSVYEVKEYILERANE